MSKFRTKLEYKSLEVTAPVFSSALKALPAVIIRFKVALLINLRNLNSWFLFTILKEVAFKVWNRHLLK